MTNINASNVSAAPTNDKVAGIRADIGVHQQTFASARSRRALAKMVASTFRTVAHILENVEEDIRNLVLSQYQIDLTRAANRFSPWIAACWGEEDMTAKKVPDMENVLHPKWMPDKSMSRYFHTMEALSENGFDENSDVDDMVDWIMAPGNGGSQAVANKRQKRLADAKKPDLDKIIEMKRSLFLSDGAKQSITLDPTTLGDVKEFFTLVVEKTAEGFIVRGVGNVDGTAALNKLADGAYESLKAAREKAEEKAQWKAEYEAEQNAKAGSVASGKAKMTKAMLTNAKSAALTKALEA